jgi:membrane-bound ClpP family serine protease
LRHVLDRELLASRATNDAMTLLPEPSEPAPDTETCNGAQDARGIAEIDGQRIDVVSDGDLISAGEKIEVTRVDGNRIVVRRLQSAPNKE